jgi:hypothetical protein
MIDLTDMPNGTLDRRNATKAKPQKAAPTTRTKKTPKRLPRADRVMYISAAVAPWGLAVVLLAVSMPHLASGFQTITHCGPLSAWLLAVAFDTAQLVGKLQLTLRKRYEVGPSARWAAMGIIGSTTLMSMALNVLAFLAGATDTTGTVLAWTAGILLPLLVLALSYVGSCFALATTKSRTKVKV